MKEIFDFLITKFKKPKIWFAVVWIIFSVAIITVTLISLAVNFLPEILTYVFYGLSALGLSYSVYIVIIAVPKIKGKTLEILKGIPFTANILANYGFRTTVFAVVSFLVSVGHAIIQAIIAFASRSVWYGALAGYYIILALSRGLLLNSKRRIRKISGEKHFYQVKMIKIFRATGISLMVITIALSAAIFHMATASKTFSYPGLTVYASATYAFYKIIMSVYNFIKAKKYKDLAVWSIRNINLADALVSILALQTALISTFGNGVDGSVYNMITGIAVSVIIIGMGTYMIVKSNLMLRRYK